MGNNRSVMVLCLVLLLSIPVQLHAQQKVQPQPLTRILFLFDASQSMYGRWESDTKFEVAKRILTSITDSLQKIPNVETALHIYGHTKRFPPQDCDDNRLEVPFSKTNAIRIRNKLDEIRPSGTTPIARSLEACANDFPDLNSRNIIILITDGIEECDGDPCAVSKALQKKGIFLKPFVIGLNLSNELQKQFECVGTFFDAATESTFNTVMNVVITQALNNTTLQVNLIDDNKVPSETNVSMTFYDQFSGAVRYNFVHTIHPTGVPDTLVVDPLSKYTIVVHTIPQCIIDSVTLVPGKHTHVGVNAGQGDLLLKYDGLSDYKNLKCIVRENGQMNTLNVQEFNSTQRYLTGKYDLEILTLPRMYIPNVDISQSKTTTIQIPNPGLAALSSSGPGYGAIFVEEGDQLKWVVNFDSNLAKQNIILLPGKYKAVFRPKNARETKYTVERSFRVTSGTSVTVNLN
ncbi:MAG: vWA domain-containing protein [Bacteroidota bacterium]